MAGFVDVKLEAQTLQDITLGDNRAVASAYRELAGPVLTLATRILQDRGQAQEVLQDTFVDLIERGRQIHEADAVVGWVRKVAVNHCLMRLRSPWNKRRVVGLKADVAADSAELDITSPMLSGTGRDTGSLAENLPDITQALAKLAPETRVVVWLHDVEGYTHKEIGGMFEKTSSYSKSQLARGYELLARLYQRDQRGPNAGADSRLERAPQDQQEDTDKHVQDKKQQRDQSCQTK